MPLERLPHHLLMRIRLHDGELCVQPLPATNCYPLLRNQALSLIVPWTWKMCVKVSHLATVSANGRKSREIDVGLPLVF